MSHSYKGSSLDRPCAVEFSPRVVFVTLQICYLEKIDIIEHSFVAEVFMNLSWRDDELHSDELESIKKWVPHVGIKNIRSTFKRERWYRYDNPVEGKGIRVNQRTRIKGEFNQRFDLKAFPFDIQDLSVTLVSTAPLQEVVLSHRVDARAQQSSFFDTSMFLHRDTWLCSDTLEFHPQMSSSKLSASALNYSELVGYMRIGRYSSYFARHFVLPSWLITVTPLVTYWLPGLSEKLSVTLSMIFTMFAFRFAASSKLPVVNYATLLDQYLQASVIFLFLMIPANTLSVKIHSHWFDASVSMYLIWLAHNALLLLKVADISRSDSVSRPSSSIRGFAESQRLGPGDVLEKLGISLPSMAGELREFAYAKLMKERTSSITGRLMVLKSV
jgi:hypothetical protein